MLYKDISEPFIFFSYFVVIRVVCLGGLVVYEGNTYTLSNVNEDIELYSNDLYGYKLSII